MSNIAKILHIVNSLNVGGLEQVVVNLINRLGTDEYEHVICCIDSSGPMAERINLPVKVHAVGKGAGADYFMPFKIADIIKQENPDIVHTRNWSAIDGVIGAALAGVKLVIHDEHGRDASDPDGANRKRKLIRKVLSPWISRFVPVSTDLETWLVNSVGVPSGKVQKILNGVDTERFIPPLDKKQVKVSHGIDAESFVIGFVGRLDPVKDLPTLLKAFAAFSVDLNRNICLCIVGKGGEQNTLQDLCNDLGISSKVTFAGEQADIPAVMQCFDLFALTSIAEGIPMTILESMATGLPVVATNVGGVGEVVEHGGNGQLAPVKGVDEIAAAFTVYANNPELMLRHGKKARDRAEMEFSLTSMVAQYDALYKCLLAGKRH